MSDLDYGMTIVESEIDPDYDTNYGAGYSDGWDGKIDFARALTDPGYCDGSTHGEVDRMEQEAIDEMIRWREYEAVHRG